jgi:1,3-beta-glucanosyltransferase GAS5
MSLVASAQQTDPVSTKGNWFWKDDERFLIKGISYLPYHVSGEGTKSRSDPLDDARLDDLKRDIEIFHELGLNTIQISGLSPGKSYRKAMELLSSAGIHVLVTLLQDFNAGPPGPYPEVEDDSARYYTPSLLRPALQIADEMAIYPNLLGFVIAAEAVRHHGNSKLAEVYSAVVRDLKAFLRQRRGRCPPVGVSVNDVMMLKKYMLEYFTAGALRSRADFFAMDSWGWANKSSFQVSGWKGMVEAFGRYPVPMYLSAFGARVGKARLWEEIGCLYSSDMTGVFSGGCLYTYLESGNRYGVVQARGDGVERKKEFEQLKTQFHKVNLRDEGEVDDGECKDYEGWRGEFPEPDQRWNATSVLPVLEDGLESLIQDMSAEKEDRETEIATKGEAT